MSFPVVAWVDEMPDPGTYTKTTEDERKVLAAIRAGTHVVVPRELSETTQVAAARAAGMRAAAAIVNATAMSWLPLSSIAARIKAEVLFKAADDILAAAEPPA